jgi:hypothetical protein
MINSNLDIVKAKSLTIDERCPYLEYLTPGLDVIDNMPSPRYIKTHMPLKFLPEDLNKAKVGLFLSDFVVYNLFCTCRMITIHNVYYEKKI